MPTLTQNKSPSNSTATLFREWCQFVSDGIANAGWVQTSDTGQINLNTVSAPSSTNQSMGYQIWRTNDSLTPVYLKLEYGSGLSTNNPAMWAQLGWGSNGSGTLTGNTTTRHQVRLNGNTTTQLPCYASGTNNMLAIVMFSSASSSANYALTLLIERLRNSSGSVVDNGAWIGMFGTDNGGGIANSRNASQVCLNGGTNPTGIGTIPLLVPRNSTNIVGSTVGVYPIVPIGQTVYPAILGAVGFYYADIGDATTFTLSRYGTNRTYLATRLYSGNAPAFGTYSGDGVVMFTSYCPAILWE